MISGKYTELAYLIEQIQQTYTKISDQWVQDSAYRKFNLKKNSVYKMRDNAEILEFVWAYRDFLVMNVELIYFVIWLNQFGQTINTRIKTRNSIEYKIENYSLYHENGNVPINKCLNDVFGIRIILSDEISHKEIHQFVKERFPFLKCIDSSKADYQATHIYFIKDNFSLPWELQIWRISNKEANLISHKQYKQGYTNWEKKSKGAV